MQRNPSRNQVALRQRTQSVHLSEKLSSELLLRYICASAATLVALAGAQLVVRTDFILALALVTILGTPISLALRLSKMKIGSLHVPRPIWNSLIVLVTLSASGFYLTWALHGFISTWNGTSHNFWLRFGAGDTMAILIQIFLIFASFRSFSLITDKDCTLATVPSFSVLLLLIPVHKGIEVVGYFLAWTVVAALLFALDHRSEQRSGVIAVVTAQNPGADSKMAARSLGAILGISLVAAIGISVFITSRNPDDRSEAETAVASLAGRLTQLALSMPESSMSGGPERQIDFSSNPSLPSRNILWQVGALSLDGEVVNSDYFRLFTLSDYNGSSWTQGSGGQKSTKRKRLTRPQWPLPRNNDFDRRSSNEPNRTGSGYFGPYRNDQSRERPSTFGGNGNRVSERLSGTRSNRDRARLERQPRNQPSSNEATFEVNRDNNSNTNRGGRFSLDQSRELREGYPVSEEQPQLRGTFGQNEVPVRQVVTARSTNIGFVPLLPAAQTIRLPQSDQKEIRSRKDGAIDVGVIGNGGVVRAFSYVPRIKEYGFKNASAPTNKVAQTAKSPRLTSEERARNLALPASITPRLRRLAREYNKNARPNDSNSVLAGRIAIEIQRDAVYTLRPPSVPNGRDAADFFLFEGNKRGYCTYFAGALTVLCRINGIPARVVSGFASPEYNNETFGIVREANAHAWTEVWVENWGWVPVDATPSGDIGDNAPTWIENWTDFFGASLDSAMRWGREHLVAVTLGLALFVALILAYRWRRFIRKLLNPSPTLERENEYSRREISALYAQTTKLVASYFRPRRVWETPDEWLQAALAALPLLPREPLETLTSLYIRASFSPMPLDMEHVESAQKAADYIKQKRRHYKN
jgi:hypothetical protein